MKTVIIGAGNVAWHLSHALTAAGMDVVQVFSRSELSAKNLAEKIGCDHTTAVEEINPHADFYLVSLRDEITAHVIGQLKFSPALIAHTSGTLPISVFPSHFINTGVLYPLMTFSKTIALENSIIPICVEGSNDKATEEIYKIACALSEKVSKLDHRQRVQLHLAAVFANNFSNHLFSIANELLEEHKISGSMLYPLMQETVRKAIELGAANGQTGPARRSDSEVIEKHLNLLADHPRYREIYRMLTESILSQYGKRL